MGSTVQTLLNGKTLEAYAKLVDNDCRDYQIVQGAFLRTYPHLSQQIYHNKREVSSQRLQNVYVYKDRESNGMVKNVMCALQMALKESKNLKIQKEKKLEKMLLWLHSTVLQIPNRTSIFS
ncbi:unnamed protein product, partial [Bubo scandiacus]